LLIPHPLLLRAQPTIPERIATSRLIIALSPYHPITLSHDRDLFYCDHCLPVHSPNSL